MKFKIIILILIIIAHACQTHTDNIKTIDPITIDIQPFDDFSETETQLVLQYINTICPNIELKVSQSLPSIAYYNPRNRYRADSIIYFLKRITPLNHISIGLTTKDISHTKGAIKDYGIMGLGFMPGNACVISTFRISKTDRLSQLYKLCIHELGHTSGLPHCPEKICFIRDARGKNHFNELTSFCSKCKNHLVSKGWKFN